MKVFFGYGGENPPASTALSTNGARQIERIGLRALFLTLVESVLQTDGG